MVHVPGLHCVAFTENALFKHFEIICSLRLLFPHSDKISIDKRDKSGFFSNKKSV